VSTAARGPVVVVGAGVAGTAAALAARLAGAAVTLVDRGAGAAALATGAIDCVPWENAIDRASAPALTGEARAVLDAFDAFAWPEHGATLATTAGILRPARGHDAALLDVGLVAGRPVAVVRCPRPGWDADVFAAAWGPSFTAVDAPILRHRDEERIPDADFAGRHDDLARLEWLAARLRQGVSRERWAAVVVPPSLGVERPLAAALSERVGMPCGEALGAPGGPSGLRFECARDRALSRAGVKRIEERVASIEAAGGRWRVVTASGAALDAAAVVLAMGGLIAGGLEYAPAEATLATALPSASRPPIRLGLQAPVTIGAHGRPLDLPSSLFGAAPEDIARPFTADPLLERAGVLAGDDGAVSLEPSAAGVYAAGDVVADAPRTWGAALSSGAAAGAAAARHVLTESPGAVRRASDGAPATLP
jgi:glycerol-3-phosphate dehydrogenase subunit B